MRLYAMRKEMRLGSGKERGGFKAVFEAIIASEL